MTAKQEAVKTLFAQETLDKVDLLFKSDDKIVAINSYDLPCRLYKPTPDFINLEILIQMPIETNSGEHLEGFGTVRTRKVIMYFKPAGFYTKKVFQNQQEVTIVKEFEEDLDHLWNNENTRPDIRVNRLSLRENAVLAGFSMEAVMQGKKYQDVQSFTANGLLCDIFLSNEGYPQLYLDDKYGLEGAITAYLFRERDLIAPGVGFEPIFEKFHSMSLLTSQKVVQA